jgi:hypothetical protein
LLQIEAAPSQFLLGLAVVIFSIASLTVKLAALARGGNSLKLSRHCAMTAYRRKQTWFRTAAMSALRQKHRTEERCYSITSSAAQAWVH